MIKIREEPVGEYGNRDHEGNSPFINFFLCWKNSKSGERYCGPYEWTQEAVGIGDELKFEMCGLCEVFDDIQSFDAEKYKREEQNINQLNG